MFQDEASPGPSGSQGDEPHPPSDQESRGSASASEVKPWMRTVLAAVAGVGGVSVTASLAFATTFAQGVLTCVGFASAAWLSSNAFRRARGTVMTDDGRRLWAAAGVMLLLGAANLPVEPLAGVRLVLAIPLLGWAYWLARPHPPAGTPARGGPNAWIELGRLLPNSCQRLARWEHHPASPLEPNPLVVVGVVLLLILSGTGAAGAGFGGQTKPKPAAATIPAATPTPSTIVTPESGPVSDAPVPVEQPDAQVTPSTPPRPDCARNPAVLRTLSPAQVPTGISNILYEAWAQWTWPVLGCASTPAPLAGHWVSVVGSALIVASRDGTQAAAVFSQELPLLQPLLGQFERINQSLKFGAGAVQLARRADGGCELAGHHRGGKPFLLNPAITNAVLLEAHHLGAIPFVDGPVPLHPKGPLTVRVRFLGRRGSGATLRQVEYQAQTLTYDPRMGVAIIGTVRTTGRPCSKAALFLDSTVSAVDAAG